MTFRYMNLHLGDGFSIKTSEVCPIATISVYYHDVQIGSARLLTDGVDVGCITAILIDDDYVNHQFSNGRSLGEAVIKYLIKYPNQVRKPEFRFMLKTPENLKNIVEKYHFNRGEHSADELDIMLRKNMILPTHIALMSVRISDLSNSEADLMKILYLLQNNAYWQTHLNKERLQLLVQASQCVIARKDNEIVGFARILTDGVNFASLWDVVVAERYRGQGVGMAMMHHIFSNPTYSTISNWILFTDTAKSLYAKFGFVSEQDVIQRTLVHKLRLQSDHPSYMKDLISELQPDKVIELNETQTHAFLFTEQRAQLISFWQSAVNSELAPIIARDIDEQPGLIV